MSFALLDRQPWRERPGPLSRGIDDPLAPQFRAAREADESSTHRNHLLLDGRRSPERAHDQPAPLPLPAHTRRYRRPLESTMQIFTQARLGCVQPFCREHIGGQTPLRIESVLALYFRHLLFIRGNP